MFARLGLGVYYYDCDSSACFFPQSLNNSMSVLIRVIVPYYSSYYNLPISNRHSIDYNTIQHACGEIKTHRTDSEQICINNIACTSFYVELKCYLVRVGNKWIECNEPVE